MTHISKQLVPKVCHSITLSTLHGCPSDEIERIAAYLLSEKRAPFFLLNVIQPC